MAKYEMMFITRPDMPEEELDKVIAQMAGVVSSTGGKVEKVEKMGRRRLAYRIRKQREGFYVLFALEGTGDTVREFERRLKVSDAVIKYMSVRVDEQLKAASQAAAQAPAAPAEPAGPPAGTGPAAGQAPTQS